MSPDSLKLTVYFGERDQAADGFLADELTAGFARHQLQSSVIMRGAEGFGIKHHLHTDRLLTLSEDLPLVAVAVDTRERIEAALVDLERLEFDGLVTLERAHMLTAAPGPDPPGLQPADAVKLTVYLGRHERAAGRPAYQTVVDHLWQGGLAGATVLLGVDGTLGGQRRRARFFAANTKVPLMVVAVGEAGRVAGLLPALGLWLERPAITLERVRVCKRDGEHVAEPHRLPDVDPSGLAVWQQLTVYAGEQARAGGERALHPELIRALREAAVAGATSLRGIWGYQGEQEPRGDSFWQLRRHVPMLTVTVDTPQRIRQSYEVIDRLTDQAGLVTSEIVPAFRATGPGLVHGGLDLARLGPA